jgi:hypothetical protein
MNTEVIGWMSQLAQDYLRAIASGANDDRVRCALVVSRVTRQEPKELVLNHDYED